MSSARGSGLREPASNSPGVQAGLRTALVPLGGSLVVCLATPNAVYLSADSRYCSPGGMVDDFGRKLICFGATGLLGLSGQLRFTRVVSDRRTGEVVSRMTFDLADVVAGVRSVGGALELQAQVIGEVLHRALLPVWMKFGRELDHPFGEVSGHGAAEVDLPLAQILYVNRGQSGQVYVDRIDLKHSLHRIGEDRYESVLAPPSVRRHYQGDLTRPLFFVLGAAACARPEPLRGTVQDHAHAVDILEGIFAMAMRDSLCAASVGGAIDIAVISASGREWLRQKPGYGAEAASS